MASFGHCAARISRCLVQNHTLHHPSYLRSISASFSSGKDSFFGSSSVRSQRRKRRRRWQEERRHNNKDNDSTDNTTDELLERDTRTVRDILFPAPDYGDDAIRHQNHYPKTFAAWRSGLQEGWAAYRSTWDGFSSSKGFIVEPKEGHDLKQDVHSKTEQVKATAKQNMNFLVQESGSLKAKVTEVTGVSTKEDIRRVAAEMMKLASNCVAEFMAGYRKGRDDEVEKMMTQYFQELEEKANKPRRRKIKRRVLRA
jgi:hypothetical protein